MRPSLRLNLTGRKAFKRPFLAFRSFFLHPWTATRSPPCPGASRGTAPRGTSRTRVLAVTSNATATERAAASASREKPRETARSGLHAPRAHFPEDRCSRTRAEHLLNASCELAFAKPERFGSLDYHHLCPHTPSVQKPPSKPRSPLQARLYLGPQALRTFTWGVARVQPDFSLLLF